MAAHALCSIPTCVRHAAARGWCRMHYERWQRTGDVNHQPFKVCRAGLHDMTNLENRRNPTHGENRGGCVTCHREANARWERSGRRGTRGGISHART